MPLSPVVPATPPEVVVPDASRVDSTHSPPSIFSTKLVALWKRMVWTPSLIWKMKSEVCVAYSTPSAVLYSLVSSSFDPSSSSSSVQVRLCSVAALVTIAHNLDDFNLYVFADNVDVLFGRDGAH